MFYRTRWAIEILSALGGTKVFQFLLKGSNHIFDLVFLIVIDSGILEKSMILMPEVLLLILTDPLYTSGNNVFVNG